MYIWREAVFLLYRKLKKFEKIFIKPPVCFMGCPGDPPGGDEEDITWTLTADGEGNAQRVGTTTTTKITITFSASTDVVGQNISIMGGPVSENFTVSGTGDTRVLTVTPTGSGSVSIEINRKGIEKGPKSVTVWLEGEKWLNGYTAVADGAEDEVTSTKITFTFDEAVTGLAVGDIHITAGVGATGGDAAGDVLSGSGNVYNLTILVEKQGIVQVRIDKEGIFAGNTQVHVYMEKEEGPPAIPEDGQIGTLKWRKLVVDPTDIDPEEQAENEAAGKGDIKGKDFTDAMAAAGFEGTYLRVYLDETEVPAGNKGYGIGALGNLIPNGPPPDGGDNYMFSAADPGGYSFVDIPLKFLKDYINQGNTYIYVNAWGGAKIRAILLYEPIPAVAVAALPEGTKEIAVPVEPVNPGKGWIGVPYMMWINAAKPGSYLELYVSGASAAGNGFGSLIYNDAWGARKNFSVPAGTVTGGDFIYTLLIADIKYAVDVRDYDETNKHANGTLKKIGFNIWDNNYITKILLIEPNNGEDDPPPEIVDPGEIVKAGFTLVKEISTTGGSSADPDKGSGNIEGADFAAVQAAGAWSVLRFYYGAGTGNYAVGNIKSDVPLLGAERGVLFYDLWVGDLGDLSALSYVYVNIWGGSITKCELWTPAGGASVTFTKTDDLTLSANKNIEGAAFTTFAAAAEGSFVRISWTGTTGSKGGVGKIEKGDDSIGLIDNSRGTGGGYMDIDVADIKALIGEDNWFNVNFWGTDDSTPAVPGVLSNTVELWQPGS